MIYEVQYKCCLSEFYPELPLIRYRYRRSGRFFWEKKLSAYLDRFASEHWQNEYYDEDPDRMTAYNRVRTMREILDKEYGGNLKNYVRAMVEFEIMSDLIDKEKDCDTREISLSFLTDGWEETTVRVENAGA